MVQLKLVQDPEYKDAREWYADYGWHFSTQNVGHLLLQVVEYDWLDQDDAEVVRLLMQEYDELLEDEAMAITHKAREVREAAEEIESLLQEAIEAHENGDLHSTIQALDISAATEMAHGDCPATRALRRLLLEEE